MTNLSYMPLPSSSLVLNLAFLTVGSDDRTGETLGSTCRKMTTVAECKVKQRQNRRQCQVGTATHTPLLQESTLWVDKEREWRRRGGRLNQSLRRSPAVVSMTMARRGAATDNNHIGGIEWRIKSQIKSEESNQVWCAGGCDSNKNKPFVGEEDTEITFFSWGRATIVWSLHCTVCFELSDTRKTQNIVSFFWLRHPETFFFPRIYNNT